MHQESRPFEIIWKLIIKLYLGGVLDLRTLYNPVDLIFNSELC